MSSRPASGRRPDTLFDNRYRIEQSFPRGRSGETLRAVDVQDADRPVMIRRAALQDAPAMRDGQEQMILHEKSVLEQLADVPGIAALHNSGTFRAGGQTHQYIAIDVAPGESLFTIIQNLGPVGNHLPDLEMLVIFDKLIGTLQAAHDHGIIHNNLNPQNVFWSRDQYVLTIIGWESALLLDGDSATGSNRNADLVPVGEILRFVASNGHPERWLEDASVWPQLKAVITRATDLDQHYADLKTLRQELNTIRYPLEQERDAILESAQVDVSDATSAEDLDAARSRLQQAQQLDPGHPPTCELLLEIDERLARLAFQENLHAIYVYITSGNLGRALAVLEELNGRADAQLQPVVAFLIDACRLMREQPIMPLSQAVADAVDRLLNGDPQAAGRLLVMTPDGRPVARQQQYTLAEWLCRQIPGVVLLRPHLIHLEAELTSLARDEVRRILTRLDKPVPRGVQPLRDVYQETTSALQRMVLDEVSRDIANYAQQAAEMVIAAIDETVYTIGADPASAMAALDRARNIDPTNPAFDGLQRLLTSFRAELDSLRGFGPSRDGADIVGFLVEARTRLKPYLAEISDPQFQAMASGIDEAMAAWDRVDEAIVMGGRRPALTACLQAADAIRPLSPAIAFWFEGYLKQIEEEHQVEHLSSNGALGAVLEEGWEAWDRGRSVEAKAAGERALEACRTDGERRAVQRLIDLSEVANSWLSNEGPLNPKRADQAETRVLELMLPEEDNIRRTFSKQMPDTSIYLRAMTRGIVEPMRDTSAAGVRALFLHYVLRGMLDLYEENAEQAIFWREAADRTLATARLHPAYQALDAAIVRRQLILDAVRALNKVQHISDLPAARQAAGAPLAASQLEATNQAVRALDESLQRWSEGDFRTARQLMDNAGERIAFAEATLGKDLATFKTWLQDLGASAEVLQGARRSIEQIALVPVDTPDQAVADAFQKMIEITRRDLGEAYTATVRQWRDTYAAIRDIFLDEKLARSEKRRLLDDYFADEALEQNPALPILRHWYNQIKRLAEPERPAPARSSAYTQILQTQAGEDEDEIPEEAAPVRRTVAPRVPTNVARPELPRRSVSPALLTVGMIVLVLLAGAMAVLVVGGNRPTPALPTLASTLPGAIAAAANTDPTPSVAPTTLKPSATSTDAPTATPPTLPPTITRVVPTPTVPSPEPPTATLDPNATLAPTIKPSLPAGGTLVSNGTLQLPTFAPTAQGGDYDMLQNLLTISKPSWNKDWFSSAGEYWQLGSATYRTNGPAIVVRLGPDVMTSLFGVDAATKVTRVDANLELSSYDKSLLPTGNVRFGIGMESVNGPRIAVQANLVQANVVDLGINQNGTFVRKTEFPVNTVTISVSIQRNDDNTLTLYEEGQPLGQSGPSFGPTTPVRIYLYTSAGGVVVKVTSLKVHLE